MVYETVTRIQLLHPPATHFREEKTNTWMRSCLSGHLVENKRTDTELTAWSAEE